MNKYLLLIALCLLDTLSAVAAIVCMSNAHCRNILHVRSDEEAYCQFQVFGVGCCYVRKKAAHWSHWSTWGSCSVSCGTGGTRTSTRRCKGSGSCHGSSLRTETCSHKRHCPIDGFLSDWSGWVPCSQTCGWGQQTRSRVCHQPQHGGSQCKGDLMDTKACRVKPCPVNGWTEDWSKWSSCSVTCGDGHMSRSRVCHPPQFDGSPCTKNLSESKKCTSTPCPVDGHLSVWGTWGHCTATCEGTRKRIRTCIPRQHGGAPCHGRTVTVEHCGARYCPVDGHLRNWGMWSHCTATCEGTRKRTRTCNPPQHGGALCHGNTTMLEHCGSRHCPVDGWLRDWGPWSQCSASCEGTRKRSRSCIPPKFGGASCQGNNLQLERCGAQHCPVDGVLTTWGSWTPCSVTCGGGSQVRSRACIDPQYGGRKCTGPLYEMNNCRVSPCPTPPTTTQTTTTTTMLQNTSPAGLPCPTCDELMQCTWNNVCGRSERCMIRSLPGFKFSTHCLPSDDCTIIKSLAKLNGEVFCCDSRDCLRRYLGI